MKRTTFSCLLFLILGMAICPAFAVEQTVIAESKRIGDSRYYITVENQCGTYEVWARRELQMSSNGDVLIASIQMDTERSIETVKETICRGKKIYDGGKLLLGCASTVGTGICAATGGGGGAGVAVCYVTINYAASTGFVDCLSGMAGLVGNALGEENWDVAMENALGQYRISTLVEQTIDEACNDWGKNK